MRTRIITAFAALALAACSSSVPVVIVREPVPAPEPVEPLEITIGRPRAGKLLVQTNRPAYVAIFEIIPERGVALIHPSSARQRRSVLSGLSSLPVWWTAQRTTYYSGSSVPESQPVRYIYALASDEPLRLPDEAFQPGYLRQVLGTRAYRAMSPYATMRALSRQFVPAVVDEEWAEDAYVLAPSYGSDPYRAARVYCPDRTVYEVPEEIADRVWCPTHPHVAADSPNGPRGQHESTVRRPPMRPDSVLAENGRRVRTRARGSLGRGAIDRVVDPVGSESGKGTRGAGETKEHQGNDRTPGRADDAEPRGRGVERRERDEVREHVKPRPGHAGRENARTEPRHGPRSESPSEAKPEAQSKSTSEKLEKSEPKAEKSAPNAEPSDPRPKPRSEQRAEPRGGPGPESRGKPAFESRSDQRAEHHHESNSEPAREPKAEPTPEPKAEPKAESRSEVKSEAKAEPRAGPKSEPPSDPESEARSEPQSEKHSGPAKSRGRRTSSEEQPLER